MKTISFISGRRQVSYLFLLVFYISATNALAYNSMPLSATQQQTTITGTLTYNNMPMTGVTISVKGKNTTAISGEDGKFFIAANGTDTLIFEYLGFKTQTVALSGKTNLTVQLEEEINDLKEVTVNAGYYTVKETERTGSISKITAKDIEKQPVTNVLAAMQGRMAGVNITQDSGLPGGGFNIQIRGQNSLRADGNRPLYIIDGVPYASETTGYSQTSGAQPASTNPLNSINPNDIESIEVLKDADATAIYGSRGSNGVVLITTKKGKPGKTQFTAGVRNGTGKVTRFMELMNTSQYLQMRREAFANDGIEPGPSDYDINGTWSQTRDTNWQKELIGGIADYNDVMAAVSGGSEQTSFSLGGNYHRETTVFPGSFWYKKGNVHLGLNHESLNKRFKVSVNASYTAQRKDQPGTDLTAVATGLSPNAPALYNADGSLNWEDGTWENPLAALIAESKSNTADIVGSTLLSYTLLPGLEAKTSFGFTSTSHSETFTQPSTMYNPAYELGSEYSLLFVTNTQRRSWIVEPQLAYDKSWGRGKASVLFGGTFQQQNNSLLAQMADGFTSNALIYSLAAAAHTTTLRHDESVYKYQAFFGRVNYNWDKRYILNLTGRRDGSSRFGSGRRYATFGAVGAAWVFSEEALLKDRATWLSFGKLRASYGTSGSDQIGDYQYLDTYAPSGSTYGGVATIAPTRLFNPDFGWETNKKLEVALETGFLDDRIFFTSAWYRNRSSSQLVGIPLPATTGFTSLQANLDATVENRGLEFTLRTVNIKSNSFNWTTSFNIAVAKNELLSFPGLEGSTYKNRYVVGKPLNILKLYHYEGLNPQTGTYTFTDYNNDGSIASPDDRQSIVDLNPDYFGGLQNQISYGRWQLDFLFQFVKQQNYNATYLAGLPGAMANQPSAVVNHWQQPGDTAGSQLYTTGVNGEASDAFYRYYSSDAIISDASYIRLKNVSLSYSIPEKWLAGISCRASIEGQNLATITSYKGRDPEFRTSGFLPPLRILTAGLQFTF